MVLDCSYVRFGICIVGTKMVPSFCFANIPREGYLASFLPALLFAYSNPVSLELTTSEHTKLSLLEDCETSRSLFFSLLLLQS